MTPALESMLKKKGTIEINLPPCDIMVLWVAYTKKLNGDRELRKDPTSAKDISFMHQQHLPQDLDAIDVETFFARPSDLQM